MRRRQFIAGLAGAAAWPLSAHAQHSGKLPTIGFMSARAPDDSVHLLAAFHRGLAEEGFVLYSATSRQRSIVAPSLRSWTVIVRALIKAVTTGRDTRA